MIQAGHSFARGLNSTQGTTWRAKQDIDFFQLSHSLLTSEQQWHEAREARAAFLKAPESTTSLAGVRPTILESWKRSHASGIDPEKSWLCTLISEADYQQVCLAYDHLTTIARPLMHMIDDLHLNTNYIFELVGLDGMSLIQLGNMSLHDHVADNSIFNETTMGTNAHSLSIRHKTPYLVIGPEHYCSALHDLIAYAVPIFGEDDKVIASLLFTRLTPDTPWSKGFHKLLSHTVGLIASIATSIESQLRFSQALSHMHEMEDEMLELRKHSAPPATNPARARVEEDIIVSSPLPPRSAAQARTDGEKAAITFEDILGNSPAIIRVINLSKRFAETDENILITGESGTGKEYFAQAIHNYSRAEGPFMSINCAAIPHRLIESELFGYESGAFTGAQKGGKPGKIELAHGGTLFLDEIGDMPLELQATLLRVLENKRVMRLGGRSYRQVDFKVVAATNRDLLKMVKDREFREDLFFRLSILGIELPPLRNRPKDLEFFLQYYLHESQQHSGGTPRRFSPQALGCIKAYSWPGNIRQLKNAVTSSYYAAQDQLIEVAHLPSYLLGSHAVADVLGEETVSLSKLEQAAIESAMQRSNYNVSKAAKLLGISKATLYRRLKEANLSHFLEGVGTS